MKLSDYIVTFLQKKGIRHFFGYQGTMIAHLVDSIERNPETENHSSYNEQGAAFAACGYAQAKEECACAYATSGPGAINLLSGVADAYYDSLPVIFLTGQGLRGCVSRDSRRQILWQWRNRSPNMLFRYETLRTLWRN